MKSIIVEEHKSHNFTHMRQVSWNKWLKGLVSEPKLRRKKDLVSTGLGAAGTGLGILNSVNLEVLNSKLGRAGSLL